jgi:DNA-directed RNA polymerase specialized sigma24 family protein
MVDEQLERQIREHVIGQMPVDRMPPGGQWSEPPAIYLALAAMLKSDCLKYPDELPGPHGLVVEKVLAEMRLKDGQRHEAIERMVADLRRFLSGSVIPAATCVDFLKIVTLRSLMPIIRTRAEGYAYKRNVLADDVSDLGGEVVGRILRQLDTGKAPDDNAGAYYARTCYTTWVDYGRKMDRNREFVGDEEDAGSLAQSDDWPSERAIENLSIDELDDERRQVIILWRCGYKPPEIAKKTELKVAKVKRIICDYLERS